MAVIETLGVGRGSLYAAFGSKDGLYRAALTHYLDLMGSAMLRTHQTVLEVTSANRNTLERALAEAVARGEITPSFDPRSLAAFLVACLTGMLVSSKIGTDLASLTRIVEHRHEHARRMTVTVRPVHPFTMC